MPSTLYPRRVTGVPRTNDVAASCCGLITKPRRSGTRPHSSHSHASTRHSFALLRLATASYRSLASIGTNLVSPATRSSDLSTSGPRLHSPDRRRSVRSPAAPLGAVLTSSQDHGRSRGHGIASLSLGHRSLAPPRSRRRPGSPRSAPRRRTQIVCIGLFLHPATTFPKPAGEPDRPQSPRLFWLPACPAFAPLLPCHESTSRWTLGALRALPCLRRLPEHLHTRTVRQRPSRPCCRRPVTHSQNLCLPWVA